MKISGAEWLEFYCTAHGGWPKGYIWTDESTLINGRDIEEDPPKSHEVFVVPSYWHMEHESGPRHPMDVNGNGMNVCAMIRAWRKERAVSVFVVRVPKSDEADAQLLFADRGWKVT